MTVKHDNRTSNPKPYVEGERITRRVTPLAEDDPRHGKLSSYQNYKCRCSKCRRANASYEMKRKYGINMNERDRMIEAQGWLCAACPTDLRTVGSRAIHIDHDHATGAVRGILCHTCNVSLGLMGESVERIEGLLAYARKHQPVGF